jgi:hypothetical protein
MRDRTVDWLMQVSANTVGTLAALGVAYALGAVTGAITPNEALNILVFVVAVLMLLVLIGLLIRSLLPPRSQDGGENSAT